MFLLMPILYRVASRQQRHLVSWIEQQESNDPDTTEVRDELTLVSWQCLKSVCPNFRDMKCFCFVLFKSLFLWDALFAVPINLGSF